MIPPYVADPELFLRLSAVMDIFREEDARLSLLDVRVFCTAMACPEGTSVSVIAEETGAAVNTVCHSVTAMANLGMLNSKVNPYKKTQKLLTTTLRGKVIAQRVRKALTSGEGAER